MHRKHAPRPADTSPARATGLPVRTRLKAGFTIEIAGHGMLPASPRTGFAGSMGDLTDI